MPEPVSKQTTLQQSLQRNGYKLKGIMEEIEDLRRSIANKKEFIAEMQQLIHDKKDYEGNPLTEHDEDEMGYAMEQTALELYWDQGELDELWREIAALKAAATKMLNDFILASYNALGKAKGTYVIPK